MADNSLQSVLTWMKENTRMLGWGLIVAFERRKANLLIIQEYIKRFGNDAYLPVVKGAVPIVDNEWLEYVHEFVLDVPRLSFENVELNDSKAVLTMAVMGGSQVTLRRDSTGWKANKVNEIDPLQGPKLYLDLKLNDVPGDVDKDGLVKLDLSKSDNFRLTFGATEHEQRMGGDFFKDLFNQLPDEKRIFPLGRIKPGNNELLQPQSFELRTQGRKAFAKDDEGAILALVRMIARNGGNYPGQGYKYLIPDDAGKDYSATVLFDSRRVAATALLAQMDTLLGGAEFNYTFEDGELIKATATQGGIMVPGYSFETTVPVKLEGFPEINPKFTVYVPKFYFNAVSPSLFEVDFSAKKLSVRFNLINTIKDVLFVVVGVIPVPRNVSVAFNVVAEYDLVEEGGLISLKQTSFIIEDDGDVQPEQPEALPKWPETLDELAVLRAKILELTGDDSCLPRTLEELAALRKKMREVTEADGWPETPEQWATFWAIAFVLLVVHVTSNVSSDFLAPHIQNSLGYTIQTNFVVNDLIKETIELNFGQAIQGDELKAPLDVGFFGRINPAQTSFVINQMEPTLLHGGTLKFTTEPSVTGVKWSVDNLEPSTDFPGVIHETTGQYVAPTADQFDKRYTRVRVTATDPATGYFSSALVTVVANALTVNPLIQICDVGATVELSAGQVDEGALTWELKNPVSGSGQVLPSDKPEGDHTYHHGPKDIAKTFVLDEIEVKSTTGAARSVHVLALQKPPMLTVKVEHTDSSKGQVQLSALFDGEAEDVEWLPPLIGPGSIDETGLYTVDPLASHRYVLIVAQLPFGTRLFEGYIVLPLPLNDFSNVFEVLIQ